METVNIIENSKKAYLSFSTVAICKLLTIFTHILKNKSNNAVKLTTKGRSRMSRQLLSKMPIISLNLDNILHTVELQSCDDSLNYLLLSLCGDSVSCPLEILKPFVSSASYNASRK